VSRHDWSTDEGLMAALRELGEAPHGKAWADGIASRAFAKGRARRRRRRVLRVLVIVLLVGGAIGGTVVALAT
jgi:hypothetical protein